MDTRKLLGNFGVAAVAQGLSLLLSLFISFAVPKILGVAEFGYWQLFIFYTSYAGFFMLGINDGIYLIDGGKKQDELDAKSISSQFLCGMLLQVAFGVLLGVAGMLAVDEGSRTFVLIATGFYLVVSNATGFLGYMFQTINETKWFSLSTVIDKVVFLIPLCVLVSMQVGYFQPYVICYLLSRCFALAYCGYKGRFLFRDGLLPILEGVKQTFLSASVGIKLMLANIASMLILGVARFVIDAEWGIETFGQFSFALTLDNFFLVFIAQLAMVLFPALRQATKAEQKTYFTKIRDALSLGLPLVYVAYYPLCLLVGWWLPDYLSALYYLGLVLPICVFESKMNLIGTTYYKVLRFEKELLLVNVATVALSAIGVFVGVYMIGSIEVVILWVMAAIACRSVYSEHRISRSLEVEKSWLWAGEAGISLLFVGANMFFEMAVAFAISTLAVCLYLVCNRRAIKALTIGVRKR